MTYLQPKQETRLNVDTSPFTDGVILKQKQEQSGTCKQITDSGRKTLLLN